jgi:hypothetical protein
MLSASVRVAPAQGRDRRTSVVAGNMSSSPATAPYSAAVRGAARRGASAARCTCSTVGELLTTSATGHSRAGGTARRRRRLAGRAGVAASSRTPSDRPGAAIFVLWARQATAMAERRATNKYYPPDWTPSKVGPPPHTHAHAHSQPDEAVG